MIAVTRLNGTALALNPSLIERIEHTPDTVLSLTTGNKYVVAESMDEVIERIRAFQASVIVTAERMRLCSSLLTNLELSRSPRRGH